MSYLIAQEFEWQHLKPFGYAPGNYMGLCQACKSETWGLDKRAITCRECSEMAFAAAEQPAEPIAWLEFADHDVINAISPARRRKWIEADPHHQFAAKAYPVAAYAHSDPRIAALKELLADAGQGLRVLKTMLKIEHLPGGAAAAEQLIERIEAALGDSK